MNSFCSYKLLILNSLHGYQQFNGDYYYDYYF